MCPDLQNVDCFHTLVTKPEEEGRVFPEDVSSDKIDPIPRRVTSPLNVYRTFGETGVDSRLSRLVFM